MNFSPLCTAQSGFVHTGKPLAPGAFRQQNPVHAKDYVPAELPGVGVSGISLTWLLDSIYSNPWSFGSFLVAIVAGSLDVYYLLYRFYFQTLGRLPPEERAALGRGLRDIAQGQLKSEEVRRKP
jgi:hypothetical protein